MLRKPALYNYSSVFLVSMMLIVSCNNGGADKATAARPSTDSTPAVSAVGPTITTAITSGRLDTLWVDSAKFAQLPTGKVVFVFTIGGSDTLTLNGWNAKGVSENGFDSLPDIYLKKGAASSLTYGPGTYFGNVILKKPAVAQIKNLLNAQHAQYVLFAPKKSGEHILYDIFISKEDPSADKQRLVVATSTGQTANPSPPRTF